MEAPEPAIEQKPKFPVIRLFGILAFMFGVPYLVQAASLLKLFFRQDDFLILNLAAAIIAIDLVIGVAAMFAGIGLFLHREWARQTWLAFLPLLLIVHLHMTALQIFGSQSRLNFLYKWMALVFLISILSWAYLAKARTKARFH